MRDGGGLRQKGGVVVHGEGEGEKKRRKDEEEEVKRRRKEVKEKGRRWKKKKKNVDRNRVGEATQEAGWQRSTGKEVYGIERML